MKYLIISPNGLSAFMIPHLGQSKEVEKIYFCCPDKQQPNLLKDMNSFKGWGKLELCTDPFLILNQNGSENLTVLIDDVGIGPLADHLRGLGFRVIGGSELTDRIENDRQFGTDLMNRIMDVPKSTPFTSFEQGMSWLKGQDPETRYVFKPDNADCPKEYTYVADDISDLISTMKDFKSKWKWETKFQLQEFIKGVECDVAMWFNGDDFVKDQIYYFENKKVLTGDLGVAGGGEVAAEFATDPNGLYKTIFDKLKPVLKKSGYVGQIAINTMISEDNKRPYFLEITARFGYPSLPLDITLMEDANQNLHNFFQGLLSKKIKSVYARNRMAVVLVVSTPPYPHGDFDGIARGLPVSWESEWDRYIFPYGIMYDKDSRQIVLSDGRGYVFNVACSDTTIDGAKAMLYDTYISAIKMRHKQYRTDLAVNAKERIKKVKEWGLVV